MNDFMLPKNIWLDRTSYPHNGILIVLCGFDGAGKTTQVSSLGKHCKNLGQDVLIERQPTNIYRNDPRVQKFLEDGGSQEDARILALLAAADRHHHIKTIIKPALADGKTVICDRYVYSSLALFEYRGLSTDFLCRINFGIPKPDIAFFLDVPAPELLARIKKRGDTKKQFEESKIEYVENICSNYRRMEGELVMIDGTQPPDMVHDSMVKCLGVQVQSSF